MVALNEKVYHYVQPVPAGRQLHHPEHHEYATGWWWAGHDVSPWNLGGKTLRGLETALKALLRLLIPIAVAIPAYEFCMNVSVILWARSSVHLRITEMVPSGWESARMGSGSKEAHAIRIIASHPRIWYVPLVDYVPSYVAYSNGAAVSFSGGEIFGGAGVLGDGGFWMLFPDDGAAVLTPAEAWNLRKWWPKFGPPQAGGTPGGN